MKPVTLWARQRKGEPIEFNHLEDGHNTTGRPTPKCDLHKRVWVGGKWYACHAWLDDKNVIRDKQ